MMKLLLTAIAALTVASAVGSSPTSATPTDGTAIIHTTKQTGAVITAQTSSATCQARFHKCFYQEGRGGACVTERAACQAGK